MSQIDDGGPAFPRAGFHNGMSRRDWFATFAPEPTNEEINAEIDRATKAGEPARGERLKVIADLKLKYADAMIARSKENP